MQRSRIIRGILPWLPYVLISAIHVAALAVDSPVAGPTKLLLMPTLAIPLITATIGSARIPGAALLFIALAFSWLGDEAGAFFPFAPELPLMLGFFGVAHIAYIAAFLRHLRVRRLPWWSAIYAVWWVGMLVFLGPHTGSLLAAVAAYGIVLAGTAATASACLPLIAWGGASFLASDTLLAFRLFLPDALPAWTSPLVMLTYTLGQGLIIAGAIRTVRRQR